MNGPVGLGVIGCGVISGSHLELAAKCPAAKVVAVADLIEDRARAAAEKYGVESWYKSDDELLSDGRVDAVILAMPTGVRTPVAFKALERGKHVLLEKPVASNAAEVEKMMALRGDRVVACCSSRMSFTGHAAAAARCVESGVLGRIRVVRIRAVLGASAQPRENPPPWRQSMQQNGGGILVNWSCYELDYVMQMTGWRLKPRTVLARWWGVGEKMAAYVAPGSDADSHYTALILCDDGGVVTMERAEFTSAATDQAWEIIGTEGTLHLPMGQKKETQNAVVLDRFVGGKGVVSETLWQEGQGGPSDDVLSDFVRAVQQGGRPRTDLERALVMQKVTDGIYASAASGTCVTVC